MKKDIKKPRTPWIDKIPTVKVEYGTVHVGRFLTWLNSNGIILAKRVGQTSKTVKPVNWTIDEILARYVGLNLGAIEKEKQVLREYLERKGKAAVARIFEEDHNNIK